MTNTNSEQRNKYLVRFSDDLEYSYGLYDLKDIIYRNAYTKEELVIFINNVIDERKLLPSDAWIEDLGSSWPAFVIMTHDGELAYIDDLGPEKENTQDIDLD